MPTYEKRRHIRIDTIIRVDLFRYPLGKFMAKGYITDIGIGGIRVETNDSIDEDDDDVILKFLLPNGVYFDGVRGRVLRAAKDSFTHSYGIKFLDLKFRDKFRLWMFTNNIFGCREL